MKKFIKILIYTVGTIIILGGFHNTAFAISPTVEFENTPLFGETNFVPGNSVTKWVKLNNNTTEPQRAIVRAIDVVNSGTFKLGDVVHLVIKEGATVWYDGSFSNFFSKSEVLLEQIPAGQQRTYNFIVSFDSNSSNDYQKSTMSFSLQAGFEVPTGDEVITDTTTTISGQIGGGGGGTTSGSRHLVISNENVANQAPAGSGIVIATWNTNIPATSQVIYGLASGGPYNINMGATYFGYPLGTPEQNLDPNKVINHSVPISLLPGTYAYRVVSRASPPTISYEHQFTVPLSLGAENTITTGGGGEILGANSENVATSTASTSNENNLAAVVASGLGGLFSWWWLWIILLILLVLGLYIYNRRREL